MPPPDPRLAHTKEIFLAACEQPAEQRSRFVAEACGGDEELRREVESLLACYVPTAALAADSANAILSRLPGVDPKPLARIGSYRLLNKLGEGGMGQVWEAEQESPVRRRVALKLIKWGMDTKEVVARFEAERQALALMDHSTIARVFEAGATPEGRPFFAMELVKAVPITEYCDTQRLATAERLALFAEVCQGVQHAHQKGVIHRDLKPSNVLVTLQDTRPSPKIIDFGVAKAIAKRLTERTLFTELGQWIGTPEYMSPEQAEMSGLDVDTRSDVYSLGAILYELLAGAQPFDGEELRRVGFDEMRRILCDRDPPRPSTRVSTLGEGSTATAERRRTEVPALVRELRGDLDWITMKALEKDRTRRYGSPAELAVDLERYLRHEPVLASPPSLLYRTRKFVRRHRLGVTAAALVAVALVLGVAGTVAGQLRAQREAAAAHQVSSFLVAMFEGLDPTGPEGRSVTVEQILALGLAKSDRQLRNQPLVQARLKTALGRIYLHLGRYREARQLQEEALRIRRDLLGAKSLEVAENLGILADLLLVTGDYGAAEARVRELLAMRREWFGEEHTDVADSLGHLATLIGLQRGPEAAEPLVRQVLAMRRRLLGEEHSAVAESLFQLATVLHARGDYETAEQLHRESLAFHRRLSGGEHRWVAHSLYRLAVSLRGQGKSEEAEELFRESLALHRRLLGEKHPRVADNLSQLAELLESKGDYEAAEELYREVLAIHRQLLGEDHPGVAYCLSELVELLQLKGDHGPAEELYREALALHRRLLEEGHPGLTYSLPKLAGLLTTKGDDETAEEFYRESLALHRRLSGSLAVAAVLRNLALLLQEKGDSAAAEPFFHEASELRRRHFGGDHPSEEQITYARSVLGGYLSEIGRYGEAEPLLLNTYLALEQEQDIPKPGRSGPRM